MHCHVLDILYIIDILDILDILDIIDIDIQVSGPLQLSNIGAYKKNYLTFFKWDS